MVGLYLVLSTRFPEARLPKSDVESEIRTEKSRGDRKQNIKNDVVTEWISE